MADTCIVCLGDLNTRAASPLHSEAQNHQSPGRVPGAGEGSDVPAKLGQKQDILNDGKPQSPADTATVKSPVPAQSNDGEVSSGTEKVAHLHPCGHNLHNECLAPWVERANSCPICRQNFNLVDITNYIGGPVLSSYAVADKVQTAEVDPNMFVEDELFEDEDDVEYCDICGGAVEEHELIICVGCDLLAHASCSGNDRMPPTEWYCASCQDLRPLESAYDDRAYDEPESRNRPRSGIRAESRAQARSRQLTQAAIRRRSQGRRATQTRSSGAAWTRVWEAVSNRLDLDLEFPFADDGSIVASGNGSGSRRGQRETPWQRRLRIAEENGAADEFTAEGSLAEPTSRARIKPDSIEPESQEEIRAWNAFEKAEQMAQETGKRKRKESSSPEMNSPARSPEEPPRKLKRPRTRRQIDHADGPSRPSPLTVRPPQNGASNGESSSNGPTFLQALMKEVEGGLKFVDGSTARNQGYSTDHTSPRTYYSPGSSPTASNHPSPGLHASTPPPHSSPRTGSPIPLSSIVEPVFSSPEFSPSRSPRPLSPVLHPCQAMETSDIRSPRPSRPIQRRPSLPNNGRMSRPMVRNDSLPRPSNSSPTRAGMSLEVKSEISKMVGAALKPFYKNERVSKDEYTTVNRNVSRLLYDKVGSVTSIEELDREKWEKVAAEETSKAIEVLKWPQAPVSH